MTAKIITVYCYFNGKILPLSYDGDYFTVDTAEESVRNHGLTVLYSTTKGL
jgi:hypothetical protein